jgi:polyisoprenoid-binding protein YceI
MRRSKVLSILIAIGMLTLPVMASADSVSFGIRKGGGSKAVFVSDAMLETINGVSSQLHGSITADPENLSNVRGTLEVPVKSLRTGIDLRDEHLRGEEWLNASRYPAIKFEITGVEGASKLPPNQTKRLKVKGRFSVHGVTKNVTAEARVKYIPLNDEMRKKGIHGDVIRGRARFKIELDDYNIDIPTPVRLKVSNELQINVDFRAIAQNGG